MIHIFEVLLVFLVAGNAVFASYGKRIGLQDHARVYAVLVQ